MTPVRHGSDHATKTPRKSTAKAAPARKRAASETTSGAGKLAQVRLRADELDAMRIAMRTLKLKSPSEALREGLRLLTQEATEIRAAQEIREFYRGEHAPLPEGVQAVSNEDLDAADAAQW